MHGVDVSTMQVSPNAVLPAESSQSGCLNMSNDAWPLSRIPNGQVASERGVVVLGPLHDPRYSRATTDSSEPAVIVMTQAFESGSWLKMPAPVALLGCGSRCASTSAIVIAVDHEGPVNLSETILRQKSYQVPLTPERGGQHPRCPLGPGANSALPVWLSRCITAAANQLSGGTAERTAVAAGLHLLYDDLDGSHSLSQTIEGCGKNHNGDYWHAIMHRREPDYGNSKYWFRHVGSHPVFRELPSVLEHVRGTIPSATLERWGDRLIRSDAWDPFAFVDACEAASEKNTDPDFRRAMEEVQHFEMLHLLRQSCVDAGFTPQASK